MLAELITSVNSDITAFEEVLERADIAMNYAYNQYLIESAQHELNLVTEEVSLDHPEGAASDGLIGKASKAVKNLIAAVIAFVRSVFSKIRNTIEDAKYNAMMKKAGKVAKENSKIKNKTVKVEDPSHELKIIAQYRDFLNKMYAKVKAGKTEGVVKEIDAESEAYGKKLSAAKVAAVVTVTVAAAIAMISKFSGSVSEAGEKAITKTVEIGHEFQGKSAEFVNAVVRIEKELARAAKDEASAISKAMTTAISAVKDGIVGVTEIKTNDTTAKEVVKKAMESEEAVDIDELTDSIIKEAEDNIAANDTDALVDEFTKAEEFDPNAYLESMEEKYGHEILVKEETPVADVDDISFNDTTAQFLVNKALN